MRGRLVVRCIVVSVLFASAVALRAQDSSKPARTPASATPAGARAFLDGANAELLKLAIAASRAGWVQSTHITPDTELMAAEANEALVNAITRYAKEARRFDKVTLPPAERRQLDVLKTSITVAAPPDPKQSEELSRLLASLEGTYGRGKYCPGGDQASADSCLDIEEITEILATNREPARLKEAWEGWHTISIPMRDEYRRFVELSNAGAKSLGQADTGAMWRGNYDMPPDAFAKELDRLWDQLRPLYVSLHAYVRARLHDKYGSIVPEKGPIPAHLLGNLWQQDWSNIYDIVEPPNAPGTHSLTENLKDRKIDALEMVRIGEKFFTSLGFAPQVLQFQFHRALAREAGCTGPLHRCSIYGSKAAGDKLRAMLELGASKPWPDALEALTGERQMDASAMADYFAPLKKWLDEQNRGKPVGW
jgi:peptidyl-dipeptidase A